MSATFENVYWHDGQLLGVSLQTDVDGGARVAISLALYVNDQSPSRSPWTVACVGVLRLVTSVDVDELLDNARAGNIVDGELQGNSLRLQLTGGVVEVQAREFLINAC